MKVKVYVSPDIEIGPLTDHEKEALEKLRVHFYSFELPESKINTSVQGWFHSLNLGARCIIDEIFAVDVYPWHLSRLQCVVYPWVPPGERWPDAVGTDTYHTSWKIDFRAMNPLD